MSAARRRVAGGGGVLAVGVPVTVVGVSAEVASVVALMVLLEAVHAVLPVTVDQGGHHRVLLDLLLVPTRGPKEVTGYNESSPPIEIETRVSRVVGGWVMRAKKCCAPSKIQNSKKWSRVSLRMLWNRVTMARS